MIVLHILNHKQKLSGNVVLADVNAAELRARVAEGLLASSRSRAEELEVMLEEMKKKDAVLERSVVAQQRDIEKLKAQGFRMLQVCDQPLLNRGT